MWLAIADDVSEIGLIDPVVMKWWSELDVPMDIPFENKKKLILLRIETVLKQLGIFTPSTERATVQKLAEWKARGKELSPTELEEVEEIEEIEEIEDEAEEAEEALFDSAWLEREVEREERDATRFLDTPEERQRRKDNNLVLAEEYADQIGRVEVDDLKACGAIYEDRPPSGVWLMPTQEDLDNWIRRLTQSEQLQGWRLNRKPKLLIGIGPQDYTKNWMYRFFDIQLVNTPESVQIGINRFHPDALMIYKSSVRRPLWDTMSAIPDIPLIVFDKGFSDAILSAQRQGLDWFIDAYNKRKEPPSQRRNPIRRKCMCNCHMNVRRHWRF
jgi:hypothetical protein